MKRRGAKGLGGGWVNTKGVKMIQFKCRRTGVNSMRKEEPDLNNYGKLGPEKEEGMS